MAARSKARKRALDILFEAEQRGLPTLQLLAERQSLGEQPVPGYAADLVRGVASHSDRIDALISWNLVDWTLERMPAVDRNILRIGVYELLGEDDVPDAVAIAEAVALAEDLSTDASPSFINGVLSRLKSEKPSLAPETLADYEADDLEADDDLDADDSGANEAGAGIAGPGADAGAGAAAPGADGGAGDAGPDADAGAGAAGPGADGGAGDTGPGADAGAGDAGSEADSADPRAANHGS